MRYKITITSTELKNIIRSEYRQVGTEEGKAKYGYVDLSNKEEVVSELYSQEVSDINLESVIKAVNNIK